MHFSRGKTSDLLGIDPGHLLLAPMVIIFGLGAIYTCVLLHRHEKNRVPEESVVYPG